MKQPLLCLAVIALGSSVAGGARAEDIQQSLRLSRIGQPDEAAFPDFFADGLGAGDLDGDGYSDLIVAGVGQVWVYPGAPTGIDESARLLYEQQYDDYGKVLGYGPAVATVDTDADGVATLLLGSVAGLGDGEVVTFQSGPSGAAQASEALLTPTEGSDFPSAYFGTALANAGDVNGDGGEEVLVGAFEFSEPWVDGEPILGAAFLYSGGSSGGIDVCTEQRINPPSYKYHDTILVNFGLSVSSAGDMNGDGYSDIAVTCAGCGILDCPRCGTVSVWSGSATGGFGVEDATTLAIDDPGTSGQWNYFGWSLDKAGDVDGDGYGELIVGSSVGATLYYGSAAGVSEREASGGLLQLGAHVAGIGDVDADGFDDFVVGGGDGEGAGGPAVYQRLFYGSDAGIDPNTAQETPSVASGTGFGNILVAAGDLNGDGRPEFAASAYYENGREGAAYVISPVCTWYLDADGDGYGDPAISLSDCHDQPGYAPRPDDCDDTDLELHGAMWYSDVDGDGYGNRAGGALACAQPASTSSTWNDCDDADASRSPAAVDDTADGIDQDCDAHDGPWDRTAHDCPEDTGDTADTGSPGPDTASLDDPDQSGRTPSGTGTCGCASSGGAAWATLVALGAALVLPRRRPP